MNLPATDADLLARYTTESSSAAFADLVRRHIDFVYSAARRQVRDPHLAEDVTQAVFLLLLKHARRVPPASLLGWLFNTTRFAARKAMRTQKRIQARDRRAAELRAQDATTPSWDHLAPDVDAAIESLSRRERDVVFLHYFRGQTLGEVGASLGITESAAKKRAARALKHLRSFFIKQGQTVPATALGTSIAAHAIHAAPAAVTASTLAIVQTPTGASAASLSIVKGVSLMKTFAALKLAAVIAAVCTLATTIVLAAKPGKPVVKVPFPPSASAPAYASAQAMAGSLAPAASTRPATTTNPATLPADQLIRPGDGIGPIGLDMPRDEVIAAMGQPERVTGAAHEYLSKGLAVIYSRQPEPRVNAIMAGSGGAVGPAGQQLIDACISRTAEGLGMKSTLAQITAAYGPPEEVQRTKEDPSWQSIRYHSRGIEFSLRDDRVTWLSIRRPRP